MDTGRSHEIIGQLIKLICPFVSYGFCFAVRWVGPVFVVATPEEEVEPALRTDGIYFHEWTRGRYTPIKHIKFY